MSDKFQLGIIGVGFIGEVHIQACQSLPEVEVAAICEIDKARLAEMKNQYKIPAGFTDMAEMFSSVQLDGVLIATPDHLHLEPVKAVVRAKLPFLLEKPIATTLEDAEAIIRLADASGLPALQGLSIEFLPTYQKVRERWLTGEFGTAHTVYDARILNISEARRFKGRCSVNQYVACHDFHFLLSLLGTDVDSIYAQKTASRAFEETGEADSYWNVLHWKNGAIASVLMTWGMPAAFGLVEDTLLVIGSKGSAEKLPDNSHRFVTDTVDEKIDADSDFTGYEEYENEMLHFVDMVRHGTEPAVTLRAGLRAQKLVWAAEESIALKRPVKVEL